MKNKIINISVLTIFSIILLLIISNNNFVVFANTDLNKIKVYGNNEIEVAPDTAIISVGVETTNTSLIDAQQSNTTTMNKVIETLIKNKINKDDISTKQYYITDKYNYAKDNEFMGYKVCNYINFKTKNLTNLNTLIEDLTKNGVNSFANIKYCLSDINKEYNVALQNALNNAKEKLATFNVDINNYSVAEIIEEYSYNYNNCSESINLLKNKNNLNLNSGKIKIQAQIAVTFEKNNTMLTNTTTNKENNNFYCEDCATEDDCDNENCNKKTPISKNNENIEKINKNNSLEENNYIEQDDDLEQNTNNVLDDCEECDEVVLLKPIIKKIA